MGILTPVQPHPGCGAGVVLIWKLWRCSGCGHRLMVNGILPRQTREQPWRIPAELLGRYLARHA